jgi:N-acetylneuraminic acid mutarotase
MKKNFGRVSLMLSFIPAVAHATIQYTWTSGVTTANALGTYGTAGVQSSSNLPGGRNFAVSGVDSNNATWVFGGYGKDASSSTPGYLNDLWSYSYNSADSQWEWTWVGGSSTKNDAGFFGTKGVPDNMNQPSGRAYSVSWTDTTNGIIWIFGGNGYDSNGGFGYLNDLWKYDISANQWTWIGGSNTINAAPTYGTKGTPSSTTKPGARYDSASWLDSSGNLWLFGGTGYYSTSGKGRLNDLWKYDVTTGQWTWVSGSNTGNTKGQYTGSNASPGARILPTSWIDTSGLFWIFGGYGNDSTTSGVGSLNDLWSYNPSTNQWTWAAGNSIKNQIGVYGTKGTPSSSNIPGGRYPIASWVDSNNDFWIFGGVGYDSVGNGGYLNDIWKYDHTSGQWTYEDGSAVVSQAGIWGTMGTPSSSNVISARQGVVSWKNNSTGHLFLFSGYGVGSNTGGYLNDMWEIAL